jgi:hypothetical protein
MFKRFDVGHWGIFIPIGMKYWTKRWDAVADNEMWGLYRRRLVVTVKTSSLAPHYSEIRVRFGTLVL